MKHCTKHPKCKGRHETLPYFLPLHFLVPQSLLVLCLSFQFVRSFASSLLDISGMDKFSYILGNRYKVVTKPCYACYNCLQITELLDKFMKVALVQNLYSQVAAKEY